MIAAYKAAAEATLVQQAVVDALIEADADAVEIADAQADLDDALLLEADALLAAAKGNDIDTTDPEVIARVRELLGL